MKTSMFGWITTFLLIGISAHGQGNLTPPGAPEPAMKTLTQVEPRTPISSLPFTITNSGSYYVTTNLLGDPGLTGILIYADDVWIDLNGFTLTGRGNGGAGIMVDASIYRTNVYIGNGILRNWGGAAVDLAAAANAHVERLRLFGNGGTTAALRVGGGSMVNDCSVMGSSGNGIYANFGSSVTHCTASKNAGHGIIVFSGCLVSDSVSSMNTGRGISAESGQNLVHHCSATFNQGIGIFADQSAVTDCNSAYNSNDGIQATSFSRIANNFVQVNGPNGSTNFAGIRLTGSQNVVDGNTAIGNQNRSIKVEAAFGGNVLSRNISSAQSTDTYNVATGNDVGPVGTATNSVSPWANVY